MEKRNIIYLFILLVVVTSCTLNQDIDVRLDESIIVLNSLVSPDSSWNVSLTETSNIADHPDGNFFYQPAPDATLSVYDSNGKLIEKLVRQSGFSSNYKGVTKPILGKTYLVIAEIAGRKEIQSLTFIPQTVPIEKYEIDSSAFLSNGGDIGISVSFNDPNNQSDYYVFKFLREAYTINNGDTTRFNEDVYCVPDDPVYDNNYSGRTGIVFSDEFFNGKLYTLHVKTSPSFTFGTTANMRLLIHHVSPEYYKYFISLILQDRISGDPFAQPVPLFTNIENGQGVFAGFSTAEITIR